MVRDEGQGPPLLFLHGGWGYGFYPVDPPAGRRTLIPDRRGYARGDRVTEFPRPFHASAQAEMETFLDGQGIERCALWGHSDGAIIAARMAIAHPERYSAVILEALHLERIKPASRAFFQMMAEAPDDFGPRVTDKLAAELGEHWRDVLRAGGRAWLDIAATPDDDLFDRRLDQLRSPVLVIHGAKDPRTEPGELDRLRREVPRAEIHVLPEGGHCPHSERATRAAVDELVADFLRAHA